MSEGETLTVEVAFALPDKQAIVEVEVSPGTTALEAAEQSGIVDRFEGLTLEDAKRRLGVSEAVADLVLPLGASMYRAGSALFQGAAIVFLAYLFEVPLPAGAVGGAVLATFLVSLTVAPVPSSGVVTLAPALDTLGIPLAGLTILLGIDRIPDMFRSTVNLLGQITTSVLVDAWVGEKS